MIQLFLGFALGFIISAAPFVTYLYWFIRKHEAPEAATAPTQGSIPDIIDFDGKIRLKLTHGQGADIVKVHTGKGAVAHFPLAEFLTLMDPFDNITLEALNTSATMWTEPYGSKGGMYLWVKSERGYSLATGHPREFAAWTKLSPNPEYLEAPEC